MRGNVVFNKFLAAGGEKAITIKLCGDDQRSYHITLYGGEYEVLEYIVNKVKFESHAGM